MFFFKYRHGWLGREEFVGHEIVGWKVAFRRGGSDRPLQRVRSAVRSKFGVLRQIIRDSRAWHGKVFFLDVVSIEPIVESHYALID